MRAAAMRQASIADHPVEIGKFLKARYPADFGTREQHEHRITDAGGITELLGGRQPVDISTAKRERIAAILDEPDTVDGAAEEDDD